MRLALMAAAVLVAPAFAAAQEPAPSNLKLTLAVDRAKVALGQDLQFEIRLENAGDKDADVTELVFEERSVSLAVTGSFTALGDKKRDYVLSMSRPEPQVAARLPLQRITLGAKKSITCYHRVPAVGVGKFDFTARYAGAGAEVASTPVKIEVEATTQGARLAAVVEVEEAGSFKILLTPEVSPANVTHLASLISRGFYGDSLIHRIVKGSWIQMGCPYGIGVGGPGYAVKAELDPTIRHEVGTVSMSGYEKTGYTGSQFFVCLAPLPSLDRKYTTVGKVENDDMAKITELSKRDTDRNTDAPRTPVKIKSITLTVVK